MLKMLQEQEEHFIDESERSPEKIGKLGTRASLGLNKFAAYYSKKTIFIAFLPSFVICWFRPKKVATYTDTKNPNIKKLRSIHSLIKFSEKLGYIEYGKKLNKDSELKEVKGKIRISPDGDDFVTYFGGLEALIKKYPSIWTIVALSLIPWLITNWDSIRNFVISIIK